MPKAAKRRMVLVTDCRRRRAGRIHPLQAENDARDAAETGKPQGSHKAARRKEERSTVKKGDRQVGTSWAAGRQERARKTSGGKLETGKLSL